jgi:hypothetical protein
MVARHWPKEGARQDCALALAGFLLRGGWDTNAATRFILHAARIAGDEEAGKRVSVVEHTAKQLAADSPATGRPKLVQLLGEDVVTRLVDWLD